MDFRVRFSGLCHFVENGNPHATCRMCVVLPEAANHPCFILPTTGVLIDPAGNVVSTPIDLRRQRVVFRFGGLGQGSTLRAEDPDLLNGVVRLSDIAGVFVDAHQGIVSAMPDQIVRAQVLIQAGNFEAHGGSSGWWLPGTLTGANKDVQIARRLFLEVTNLNDVEVIVINFGQDLPSGTHYRVDPQGRTDAEILVSNDCLGPANPVDRDFRYHYELLHPDTRAAMDGHLGGPGQRPLPQRRNRVPLLNRSEESRRRVRLVIEGKMDKTLLNEDEISIYDSDTGCNCLGCYSQARVFNLEGFIPAGQTDGLLAGTAAETPPRAAGKPARRSRGGRTRK